MHPFLRSSTILIVFLAVNKVFGFLEKVLIANYFGTSSEADVFIVAQGLFIAGWLFVEEIVNPALIPVLTSGNPAQREELTRRVIIALVPLILVYALSTNLAQGVIAGILYPGFDSHSRESMARVWKYFSVGCLPYYVTPVLAAFANANRIFSAAPLAACIGRASMLLSLVLLAKSMKLASAGIGMIAYAVLYCAILIALLKFPLRLAKTNAKIRDLQGTFACLALPLLLGYLFSQASQWVDVRFASVLGEGLLSGLSYAKKLVDVPVLLLSFCVGTVLLPYLSDFFGKGDVRRFRAYVHRSLAVSAAVYGIACVMFFLGADAIVGMVYARGRFGTASTELTGSLLRYYTPGLLVFSLEIIVMQACFAVRNHWPAILVGMVCAGLNIVATIVLVPRFGAVVIPTAVVAQKAVKTAVLWFLLQVKVNRMAEA